MRIWWGRTGTLMGVGSDGVPVMADEDGVEPMLDLSPYIEDFSITMTDD